MVEKNEINPMLTSESHDSDTYDIIIHDTVEEIDNDNDNDNDDNDIGEDNNGDDYCSLFSDNNINTDRDAEEEVEDDHELSDVDDCHHHKLTTDNDDHHLVNDDEHHEVAEDHDEVSDGHHVPVADHHAVGHDDQMMDEDHHVMVEEHHQIDREGGGVVVCGEGDDRDSDYNPSR